MKIIERTEPHMHSQLKKRMIKGLAAKGIGHGTLLVVRLAEIPLFLHFWGVDLYGEWLILAALPILMAMSDFGFSGAAAREITILAANRRKEEALAVFQTIFTFIIGVFSLFLLVLLSVIAALPIDRLLGLTNIDGATFTFAAGLLGLSSTLLILMRLLMGAYNSEGRYSSGYLFITFTLAGQFALTAMALALGAGPMVVAAVMLIAQIIGLILMRSLLIQIAPWIKIGVSHFDWNKVVALASPSFAGMALPMGQGASLFGVRIVIGMILGPATVVTFVAHRQLARLITIVGTFSQPFEVELSKIYGSGDIERFISFSRKSIQLLFWTVLAALLVVWTLSPPFFLLWLGERIHFDATLFALLLFSSTLEAIWIITMTPAISINQHIKPAKIYAGISLALLPLAYIACRWLGLYATSVVLVVMEAIMLTVVVRQLLAISKGRLADWLTAVTRFPWYVLGYIKRTIVRGA